MLLTDLKKFFAMFLGKKSFDRKKDGLNALVKFLDRRRSAVEKALWDVSPPLHTMMETMQNILKEIRSCQQCGVQRRSFYDLECMDCFARSHLAETLHVTQVNAFLLSPYGSEISEETPRDDTCFMFFDGNFQPINDQHSCKLFFERLEIGTPYVVRNFCRNVSKPFYLEKDKKSTVSIKVKKTCFMFRVGFRHKEMCSIMEMLSSYDQTPVVTREEDQDVLIVNVQKDVFSVNCPLSGLALSTPVKFGGCRAHGYLELQGLVSHFNICKTFTVKCPMGCNTVYGVQDLHFRPDFVGACQDPRLLEIWEEQAFNSLLVDIAQNGL